MDDTAGEMGRSATRNKLVSESDADWLFFLDADDMLHPDAFENFRGYEQRDAVWGSIVEYRDGCLFERYQVPEIRSYAHLLEHDPYVSINIGHFVRREVAAANPFDESMDTGEDWHYFLRLWGDLDCIKIRKPFLVNVRGEHSEGPRSATGVQWRESVEEQIENARKAAKLLVA